MSARRRIASRGRPVALLAVAGLLALGVAAGAGCADRPGAAGGSPGPGVVPADGPSLVERIRAPGAEAVLVNVWATWCQPCVEELPDVLRVARRYAPRGLRLVLVSGDFPDQQDAASRFLAGLGVDFESYIKAGDDMAFIDAVHPGWSGAMPATLVYDAERRLVHFHEGQASREQLEAWVLDALGDAPGASGA